MGVEPIAPILQGSVASIGMQARVQGAGVRDQGSGISGQENAFAPQSDP
jgi:hypothetical protein